MLYFAASARCSALLSVLCCAVLGTQSGLGRRMVGGKVGTGRRKRGITCRVPSLPLALRYLPIVVFRFLKGPFFFSLESCTSTAEPRGRHASGDGSPAPDVLSIAWKVQ